MSMSLKATALLGLSLVASQLTAATPLTKRDSTCTELNQRKAWSALTDTEKGEYITAELCLMNSEPQLEIEGALTRWDEVMYGHIVQSNFIHGTLF
jgi:tyrosinase